MAPVVLVAPGVVVVVGVFGVPAGQLTLEPLKIGLRGAVLQLPGNLRLLCLCSAAAHGGTPSRNNGAARCEGGSDLSVCYQVLTTPYRAAARSAGRAADSACHRGTPRRRSTAARPAPTPPGAGTVSGSMVTATSPSSPVTSSGVSAASPRLTSARATGPRSTWSTTVPRRPTARPPVSSAAPVTGRDTEPSRCVSTIMRGGLPRLCTRATVS